MSLRRKSLYLTGFALAAAGVLAARALLEARRARRAERDFPSRGRRIAVGGIHMHVTEQGEGPPIVFLHGNGATSEDFRISGLLDDLARTHRVIAFDRPGFGFSERTRLRRWHAAAQGALIQAALDQMKIERPILVGHSWGTLVALAMALDAPDRVAGLVLISGFYFAEPRLDVAALLPSTIPGVNDVLRYTLLPPLMRALAGPAYRELFRPASVSARFNEEFPKPIAARPSQLRAIAGDTANLISSARAMQRRYGELSMPVAIVTGNGDRIVDPAVHADRLHAAIAGSSLTRIPGAGHMVHHTARATVLDAITRLAAETEQRANARVTPIPASAAFRQAGC